MSIAYIIREIQPGTTPAGVARPSCAFCSRVFSVNSIQFRPLFRTGTSGGILSVRTFRQWSLRLRIRSAIHSIEGARWPQNSRLLTIIPATETVRKEGQLRIGVPVLCRRQGCESSHSVAHRPLRTAVAALSWFDSPSMTICSYRVALWGMHPAPSLHGVQAFLA